MEPDAKRVRSSGMIGQRGAFSCFVYPDNGQRLLRNVRNARSSTIHLDDFI